jgi:5'-nucleotidase
VPQGRRQGTNFSVVPYTAPNGRRFMWAAGGSQNAPARPGTDVAVNMDGFISVTPMRADLTCHASQQEMVHLFDDLTLRETEIP